MTSTFRILLLGVLGACAGPLGAAERLPDTQPLTRTGDLSAQMHEAAHRDMERVIAEAPNLRGRYWKRDISGTEAYERSILPNRNRLKEIIGLVDARLPVTMERFGDDENPALIAETKSFKCYQVRWPAIEGVHGEGLLLEPKGKTLGFVVALPDADQTPEQLVGFAPGIAPESQFARRLAENGFTVVVPTLLSRSDAGSGNPNVAMTNMPHREWIYRPAFMMGRHVIGYEVQKILAAVDWFAKRRAADPELAKTKIGVAGYGEGGLLAFYAAAVDTRIDAALVSGYFKSRQKTWEEPLYRNVFGLLREFGDAEIATLIAPRSLVVEYSPEPKVDGPPPVREGRKNCAAPGKLTTPSYLDVAAEFKRIESLLPEGFHSRQLIGTPEGGTVPFGSQKALAPFAKMLGIDSPMGLADELPHESRRSFDAVARQLRQVRELDDVVQWLVQDSGRVRNKFFLYKAVPAFENVAWNYKLRFPGKSPEEFAKSAAEYRKFFREEIVGKLEEPLPELKPLSRVVYDEPTYTAYEIELKTGEEGFAWGILCLPKNMKPGEKRPVVVCQHGRNGVPADCIKGDVPYYRNFAARLAERGFITLSPHNLYRNEGLYRMLSRKGNAVKASMFSVILRHHEQWFAWLKTLPNVDAGRIGFYGLSYGGESAMRIPTLLEGYALTICSGDFNDWTRKVASTRDLTPRCYMFTDEWEMSYFNMGSTFSYAELSYLMFPRPLMVERGHHDGVSVDSWVASEYAKTRWFYAQFGKEDQTEIEFFNGGHAINGQGTFDFLHRHLKWPKPDDSKGK